MPSYNRTPKTATKTWELLGIWWRLIAFAFVAASALVLALVMLSATRNTVLTNDVWQTGMEYAGFIDSEFPQLATVLTGEAEEAEVEQALGRIATLGKIFHFEFRDPSGAVVFETGSFHAEEGGTEYHAHDHQHDIVDSVLNPLLSRADLDAEHAAEHAPVASGDGNGEAHKHEVFVQHGDGIYLPHKYAEIIHPIEDEDGNYAGDILLLMDVTEKSRNIDAALLLTAVGFCVLFAVVASGPLAYYVLSIKRERSAAETIRYLAQHDPLTGALNRASFLATLKERLRDSTSQSGVAVHFVDLDHFKNLNDTFGHNVGDTVLQTVVKRASAVCGEKALCARLGGDEIAVIQWNVSSESEAEAVAKAIVEVISSPIFSDGHTVNVFASVGTAIAPADGLEPGRLIKCADLALYQAKRLGRAQAIKFTPSMEAELEARRRLERLLRRAVDDELFEIHYQPVLGTEELEVIGVEALLRLRDDDGNLIPPMDFVPMAEELGLIEEVGAWVLNRACKLAASLSTKTAVAVNLSPDQFVSGRLPDIVRQVLAESGLDPRLLELEVTESLFLGDYGESLDQLKAIRAMGVRIAMDDFGTGYSSLAYLWQFPFDKLKVDKSFLDGFSVQAEDVLQIVQSVVKLGHAMNMTVTAEGVENQTQYKMLKDIRCDQIQGYLLSRPMPADQIADWINGHVHCDLRAKLEASPMVLIKNMANTGAR